MSEWILTSLFLNIFGFWSVYEVERFETKQECEIIMEALEKKYAGPVFYCKKDV